MPNVGVSLNRGYLIELLQSLYPTHNVGQNYKKDKKPYLVLKAKTQMASMNATKKGGFQYYDVMCYTPDTSVILLDKVVDEVKSLLKENDIEITHAIGEDFHDEEIGMYMRYVEIRVPKEV